VHHLVKHSAPSSVANGNNNNNAGGADAVAPADDALYGRECNGKLAAAYGDAIHPTMHVGSPLPGYPAYPGRADPYRPGGDDHAAMTPSPHRPLPPTIAPQRGQGQWSPSSSSFGKGDASAGSTSDPYKLSPETATHRAAAPTTAASAAVGHGPSAAAAFDGGDAVSAAPMSSPSPSSAQLCPTQPPQHCPVGHHQPIPYYPWMGVVGAYITNVFSVVII